MRTKVTFILFIFFSIHILAQDIEVKSMKIVSTSSANAGARKDNNGAPSGLVRVQLKEPDAQFSGNVLGNVEYKNGEYWVYMATGSKRLDIKHPNYLPVTVIFADYGVKKLASGTEYQMTTKANKEKAKAEPNKKGMAAIQITPSNATLSIDGKPASPESGGLYTLSLPYGTHYYSVQYGNFAINNQMVKIDKTPKTIKVDLTEYFAKLSIDCQEKDASIYINDELKGVGSCEEMVIPDKYVIRVEKDGYHPLSQTVTLEDNEEYRHRFPKMDAIVGTLKVEFDPIGATVYLDGKEIGVTPLQTSVVPGRHKLEIKKEDGVSERRDIIIIEDKETVIKGMLEMEYDEYLQSEIKKGNGCAMITLGYLYLTYYLRQVDYYIGEGPCYNHCVVYDEKLFKDRMPSRFMDALPRVPPASGTREAEPRVRLALPCFKQALNATYSNKAHEKIAKIYAMLGISFCYAYLHQYDESFRWAKKAQTEYTGKSPRPSLLLGYHYLFGWGTPKDIEKAQDLLKDRDWEHSGYKFQDLENLKSYEFDDLLYYYVILDDVYPEVAGGYVESDFEFEEVQ